MNIKKYGLLLLISLQASNTCFGIGVQSRSMQGGIGSAYMNQGHVSPGQPYQDQGQHSVRDQNAISSQQVSQESREGLMPKLLKGGAGIAQYFLFGTAKQLAGVYSNKWAKMAFVSGVAAVSSLFSSSKSNEMQAKNSQSNSGGGDNDLLSFLNIGHGSQHESQVERRLSELEHPRESTFKENLMASVSGLAVGLISNAILSGGVAAAGNLLTQFVQ